MNLEETKKKKKKLKLVPARPIMWQDDKGNIVKKATQNRFGGKLNDDRFNLKPSIPVDLDDPVTFPPFEFYNDIQHVVRMFVGGKKINQRGEFKKIQYLPDKLYNKLEKYVSPDNWRFTPKLNTVYLFLASELLNRLWLTDTA
jgi:hypothetical protein